MALLRLRTVVLAILASCCLTCTASATSPAANIEPCKMSEDLRAVGHFGRGTEALNRHDFKTAIVELSAGITLSPNFPCAFDRRGIAYTELGNIKNARSDFNKFVELQPKAAVAYNDRGYFLSVIHEYDAAISDLSIAIKINPDYADAVGNRGYAFLLKGNTHDAISDFHREVHLRPRDPLSHYRLGEAYRHAHKYGDALAAYNIAIQLDPKSSAPLHSRCWVRAVLGRELLRALSDCGSALKVDPKNYHIFSSRGFVELRLGRYQEAIDDFNTSIGYDTDIASSMYGRGLARFRQGDAKGGAADLEAAHVKEAGIANRLGMFGTKP